MKTSVKNPCLGIFPQVFWVWSSNDFLNYFCSQKDSIPSKLMDLFKKILPDLFVDFWRLKGPILKREIIQEYFLLLFPSFFPHFSSSSRIYIPENCNTTSNISRLRWGGGGEVTTQNRWKNRLFRKRPPGVDLQTFTTDAVCIYPR